MEDSAMTLFGFAAVTVTALIWAVTAPESAQDPTSDDIAHLIVLGFVP
jgi:hypothetical protein